MRETNDTLFRNADNLYPKLDADFISGLGTDA